MEWFTIAIASSLSRILAAATLLLLLLAPGEPACAGARQVYSKVRISIASASDIDVLNRNSFLSDHFTHNANGIEVILSGDEVVHLRSTGLPYEVLVEDLSAEIRLRMPPDASTMAHSRRLLAQDGIEGFELGSMGGFYTFDEVVAELDSMVLLHPDIITERTSLGTSHEGREIWMVKISDNPNLNESGNEPAVYYDALTHAREPGSMMTTLYFMYWLIENYGTNPRATELVNEREMFFVPVVNPDGYVYNELTDPGGGGFWRKNRRDSGNGCYGVDLNRNFSYGWGYNSGSSPDPCSETYRGPAAFSEPEAAVIGNFLAGITPAIAFSTHTYADRFINPYGYIAEAPEYQVYAEFASDFLAGSPALYGITSEMLGYLSSGTTRDYLHSTGTYAWTPELGREGFWPPEETIIPTASENRPRFEYLAWVAGSLADIQNVRFSGTGSAGPNDTVSFSVGVRNRGLTMTSDNVRVTISTQYPHAIPIVASVDYPGIDPHRIVHNSLTPFQIVLTDSARFLDQLPMIISVLQGGIEMGRDTISFTIGGQTVLFSDDAENGPGLWQSSGSGQNWDTTFVDSYDGAYSLSDSRYGNSSNGTNSSFALTVPIDLATTTYPVVTFAARWSIESGIDYVRAQVSTDGGSSWANLAGRHTIDVQGEPSYTGTRHWVQEGLNLSSFVGQEIHFRFQSYTDGAVPGDGFYFDNFNVIDYFDNSDPTSVAEGDREILLPFLHQNHPNPFNPRTKIRFEISPDRPSTGSNGLVLLQVYDVLGRRVATLVNEERSPGSYEIEWDASGHPSGVYFYRMSTGNFVQTRRMVLLR